MEEDDAIKARNLHCGKETGAANWRRRRGEKDDEDEVCYFALSAGL